MANLLHSRKRTDPFRYHLLKSICWARTMEKASHISANHKTTGRRGPSEPASGLRMCLYILFIWLLLFLENSTQFLPFLLHHSSILQKFWAVSVFLICLYVLMLTIVCTVNDSNRNNSNQYVRYSNKGLICSILLNYCNSGSSPY